MSFNLFVCRRILGDPFSPFGLFSESPRHSVIAVRKSKRLENHRRRDSNLTIGCGDENSIHSGRLARCSGKTRGEPAQQRVSCFIIIVEAQWQRSFLLSLGKLKKEENHEGKKN